MESSSPRWGERVGEALVRVGRCSRGEASGVQSGQPSFDRLRMARVAGSDLSHRGRGGVRCTLTQTVRLFEGVSRFIGMFHSEI